MEVLFHSAAFTEKLMMSLEDAQMLMEILCRARAVRTDYVSGKGYVYTYIPRLAGEEFTLLPNGLVQMPEDLKLLVQVKRELIEEPEETEEQQLPKSYVMPDEEVNVE